MTIDGETSIRDQLKEARATIVFQLEEIRARSTATWFSHGREPPDNRRLIAKLEGQLHEIESILANKGNSDA